MFRELLEQYDLMSIEDKRDAIKDELFYLYLLFEKICETRNIEYQKVVDEEITKLIKKAQSEDEYLDGVYAYVEAIKEMISAVLDNE